MKAIIFDDFGGADVCASPMHPCPNCAQTIF